MEKIFTLSLTMVLLALSTSMLDAQSQRMGFYEESTQASCPPCAGFNPGFQAFLEANHDNAIFLGYQVWWPGYDPMYLDNTEEVQDRIGDYYGITGAPGLAFQGNPVGQTYNSAQLSAVTSQMSEFTLVLNAEFLDGIIHVTGSIEADMVASGDFRLRVALAEALITIQDAPGGTNGETEYHHVFKRFLGGSGGVNLADDWAVGDTYEIDLSLPVSTTNIYNYDQLEIIAWIQNDDNRYVHQAAKVDDLEMNFSFDNNAAATAASVLVPAVCVGSNTTTPTFTLTNIGSETVTSADIAYSINGGNEQTYNWSGSLEPLADATITLDEIAFENTGETSILSISIASVNGVADENEDDNVSTVNINTTTNVAGELRLILKTDNAGDETYWQITNSQGEVVASGGNASVGLTNIGLGFGSAPDDPDAYGNNQFVIENISLPDDNCYTFTITDYYGDGFGLGAGFYRLIADGETFTESATFATLEDRFFESDLSVNTQDVKFVNTFTVSPNPVAEMAKVSFTIETSDVTTISVINSLGQTVSQQNWGKLMAGAHQLDLDMSGLAAGIYLVNIRAGEASGTQTIVVQ